MTSTKTDVKQRFIMLRNGLKCMVLFGSTVEESGLVKVEYYIQVRNDQNHTIYHFSVNKAKSTSKWLKVIHIENDQQIKLH